jgi:hypothetical protein
MNKYESQKDMPRWICKAFVGGQTVEVYYGSVFQSWDQTTVKDVREFVAQQISVPPDALRLIFNGRELEDSQTLAQTNMESVCPLHGVVRITEGV